MSVCGGREERPPVAGDCDQRLAEALAEEAAVGLGEDRLQDLVAAVRRVVVGVEPDLDPVVHVRDGRGEEPGAEQEHRHPDHDEGEAAGGDVEQGQEGGEEHQRAAQVADEDEHEHRGAPDDEQRAEVLERRQGDPEHPARADDQHLAVLAQVAGEEDDDADLRELGRLEGERADLDAEVGAVDLLADPRQPRRQQQQQADRGDRVAVALEDVVVAQEVDRQREEDEAEDEPVGLVAGQVGVDPVDHHEAERGEQGDQREQVGVGVGQAEPQVDVGGEADREEVGAVDEAEVAEPRVLLGEDGGEAGGEQQGHRDQRQQLPVRAPTVTCGASSRDPLARFRCPRPARRRRRASADRGR